MGNANPILPVAIAARQTTTARGRSRRSQVAIVTGWLAGQLGYISRSLADGFVHFAYNVAMPALLFVTVAQEPARNLPLPN